MKTKVALFVNGWNGENVDNFINGFNSYFPNNDVDLFVFTSFSLTVDSEEMNKAEDAIYSLPDISFFDAVIIYGAGINSDDLIVQIVDKCKEAEVPFILQGVEAEGITTVNVDCNIGMKNLCEHLIEKHGVKEVTFIAGPKDNEDSNTRMDVVRKTLEAHGYSLKEENIYYACWEARYIMSFLFERYGQKKTELPDAFICANDQMAMFVVLFLEQLGFRIPEDIIVTGFDNLSDGKVSYPSLATVNQRYWEQGNECARLVTEILQDKKMIKKSVIPCVAIPGESCGCLDCNGEAELRKKIGRLWWSERFISENTQGREAELDMCIMSNDKFENIQQSLNEKFLPAVGEETEDFHIYLNPQYKELKYMDTSGEVLKETGFGPIMDVICARNGGTVYCENTMDVKDILLGYSSEGVGRTYILKSLKIDTCVAGYMVMRYKKEAFKRKEYTEFSNRLNKTLINYQRNIDDYNKNIRIQEQSNEFLRQTVEALATAVDAKDSYTNGHSNRVAKYSRKIAKESGMTEKECDDVYLAGLLHDVGKIGIDDSIINKKGKLTEEEFDVIKLHPGLGGQILSKIVMSPSLSVGARYHHERFDGNGYPEKLKGNDIPRIARIIAVADAYDAMTSRRSYRDIIPQMYVREELIKGIGTQFDPEYARIMLKFLDEDVNYIMKENRIEEVIGADLSYEFEDYKSRVSASIRITDCPVSVKLQYKPLRNGGQPTLLFYDSADARYYLEDSLVAGEMDFVEFVSVDITGTDYPDYVRKVVHNVTGEEIIKIESDKTYTADIFMVKQEDHLLVRITTGDRTEEITVALYDAARFLYLALTGEFCTLDILDVEISENPVEEDYIPRIAEKTVYTNGPTGDIPNVQIDGWISNHSEIMKVEGGMNISFHTMSLPSSRRVWHCPIIALFTADEGVINGPNFKELVFIRLDGEVWCNNPEVSNEPLVSRREGFDNWSIWKQRNKTGVTCKLTISQKDNEIEIQVENSGLETKNKTTLPAGASNIYVYLTGDQCALTDIHINKNRIT